MIRRTRVEITRQEYIEWEVYKAKNWKIVDRDPLREVFIIEKAEDEN